MLWSEEAFILSQKGISFDFNELHIIFVLLTTLIFLLRNLSFNIVI